MDRRRHHCNTTRDPFLLSSPSNSSHPSQTLPFCIRICDHSGERWVGGRERERKGLVLVIFIKCGLPSPVVLCVFVTFRCTCIIISSSPFWTLLNCLFCAWASSLLVLPSLLRKHVREPKTLILSGNNDPHPRFWIQPISVQLILGAAGASAHGWRSLRACTL